MNESLVLSMPSLRHLAMLIVASTATDLLGGLTPLRGKITDIGFQYDFLASMVYEESVISVLEDHIVRRLKQKEEYSCREMMRENAATFFEDQGLSLQAKLLLQRPEQIVCIHQLGKFLDATPGNPQPAFAHLKKIKILNLEMLHQDILGVGECTVMRLVGTAHPDKHSLAQFCKMWDKAKRFDIRKRLTSMELLAIDSSCENRAIWLPKGFRVWEKLASYLNLIAREIGFYPISTPDVYREKTLQWHKRHLLSNAISVDWEGWTVEWQEKNYAYSFPRCLAHLILLEQYRSSIGAVAFPVKWVELVKTETGWDEQDFSSPFNWTSVWQDQGTIFCSKEKISENVLLMIKQCSILAERCHLNVQWVLVTPRSKSLQSMTSHFEAAFLTLEIPFERVLDEQRSSKLCVEMRCKDMLGRYITISSCRWIGKLSMQKNQIRSGNTEKEDLAILSQSMIISFETLMALIVEQEEGRLPTWLAS